MYYVYASKNGIFSTFVAVRREDFRDFHDDDLSLATQFISRYYCI